MHTCLQYINENHENPVYLPGVGLGGNVVANNNLIETVRSCPVVSSEE